MRWARTFALGPVVLAAAVWSPSGSAALPSPEQLAPNTVARVSNVPVAIGTITKAEFRHALVQAVATEGRRRVPRPGSRGRDRLVRAAVNALLERVWLKGQAAEMHISVTRRQVSRERARLKRTSFKSAAEYRAFLRQFRYTRRDVYEQVELQMLSTRIQERIGKQVRSKSEEQKVFTDFLAMFNEKWRARTVCAPAYAVQRCANGPDPDES